MKRHSQLTTGLILHVRDSKEADRLITFFSPDFGRLTLSAKGVRQVKSRRGAALHPGNIVRCAWVSKGDWRTLTEVSSQEYLLAPGATLERMRDFSVVLEIIYYLSLEEIEQGELYDRAIDLLRRIGQEPDYNRGWIRQQLLEMAAEQGLTVTNNPLGQSVTKILEEALDRRLKSFQFLSVE